MTVRRQRVLIYGCISTLVTALTFVLLFSEDWPYTLTVTLVPIKTIRTGGTNIVVFRLTCQEGKRLTLSDPGLIEVPVNPTGELTPRSKTALSAATSVTNFSTIRFKRQTEFAIAAPTNHWWRLQIRAHRTLRMMVLRECIEQEWNCVKSRSWAAIPRVWSDASKLWLDYYAWSPELTNAPAAD